MAQEIDVESSRHNFEYCFPSSFQGIYAGRETDVDSLRYFL